MKERDVHNLIERQDEEGKKALYTRICDGLGLETKVKPAPRSKRALLWRVLVPALSFCIICFAIILPIALQNRVDPNPNRYCLSKDCVEVVLDTNVKEYADRNGKSMLYIDWYDVAEDVTTMSYVNKDNSNDVIYLDEVMTNGDTGDVVRLSLFDKHTYLDTFDILTKMDYEEAVYKSITIKWVKEFQSHVGTITFGDYRYYVQISQPSEAVDIVEILKGMVDTVIR